MYCTVAQVKGLIPSDTLIALTQDDQTKQTINNEVIKKIIVNVGERINAHLRGRYALPLAQKSDLLEGIALDLVRYALYLRRPEGGELPDAVVRAYKTANEDLDKIQKGDLSLGIQATQKPQPNNVWRVRVAERRFNR